MRFRASVGVALAAAALGCGAGGAPAADGGDRPGEAGGGLATARAFCDRYYDLAAAFNTRCNGGPAAEWRAQSETFLSCADVEARIASGRLVYHPDLAQACLGGADPAPSCVPKLDLCFSKVLAGQQAYGAPCTSDYDCPPDGVCGPPGTFGYNACQASVCQKIPSAVGDDCGDLQFCYGSSCLFDVCIADLAEGDDCSANDKFCATGLFCDAATTRCTAPRLEHEACDDDAQCRGLFFCARGACTARLALGDPCGGAETGCAAFSTCDPTTLRCVSAGHAGQSCAPLDGVPFVCIGGVCTTFDGESRCEAPLADGAGCFFGDECVSRGCNADNVCAACP